MKKIAIDCRCLQDASRYRGIGTMLRNLLKHLNLKAEYNLLCDTRLPALEPLNPDFNILYFPSPRLRHRYSKALTLFLKTHQINHIHFMAQYNVPDYFDFPYSITVHDLFNDHLYVNNRLYQKALAPLKEKIKKAKHIIAISNDVKQTLLAEVGLKEASIHTIYNGMDLTLTKQINPKSTILKQHAISKPYILYVGNFEARKNLATTLAAFLEFNRDKSYQFVACLGQKPLFYPFNIQRLVRHKKHEIICIHHIAYPDLLNLYKHAHALMFTSLAEGFGLPILEAMAFGVPVLSSSQSAMPEVVQDGGLCKNPTDHKDLVEGLYEITENKALRATYKTNMPKILDFFDNKKTAQHYHDFFSKIT